MPCADRHLNQEPITRRGVRSSEVAACLNAKKLGRSHGDLRRVPAPSSFGSPLGTEESRGLPDKEGCGGPRGRLVCELSVGLSRRLHVERGHRHVPAVCSHRGGGREAAELCSQS